MAFILTVLSDTIRLAPCTFRKQTMTALKDEINLKFANKVVIHTGLCICLFDILYCGKALIKYGDGCAYIPVKFRLIVFRPFIGEVLTGKIQSSYHSGIKVSLGFFDDIFIPKGLLWKESEFDIDEQRWIWHSDHGDLFLNTGETIRFVIESETFSNINPHVAPNHTCEQEHVPYTLTASCNKDGMGSISWWK
ncbi:DNA-directed RNA polymerase [Pneumocystis carinii B80]|uniref:DNA-directed RNA polymerase subunit n=1 Tax=Pneumocystis carinii (strain B80) TaxID=1408658 RepID=A0A0W4ZPF1_PNEC8|nr:DNA-directed RNA polymerase [Pneumocystis carinii B80]KTW30281.1 DNA-directed RNA polymerase [Pneumocystis carinii B80]